MSNKTKFKLPNNEQGAVLFNALMFLIVLTMLAITSMSTNTLEERMAFNAAETNLSFQAADSVMPVAWEDFWNSNVLNYDSFTDVTISNFDGNNTSITYSATHEQQSSPTRCDVSNPEQCNEAGQTAKQHYRLSSTSTTSTGLTTTVNAGGYRWGPAVD